jgi:hypothetical protein
MCFKCDLRARAQAGDDEARMTLEALDNQQLNLVWPLIVGELMEKAGLTTFTVDVHAVDASTHCGVMVSRDDNIFTATLVTPDQLDDVKAKVMLATAQNEGRVIN